MFTQLILSCLNILVLFIAAHAKKFMWYVWAVSSLLAGYFFSVNNLQGDLAVCVPAVFICVLALSVWDEDEETNRENITWGSPMLALLGSFVTGGVLYMFFHQTFRAPIFECMGAGSLLVGIFLLCWRGVSAWIILIYSFLMYAIAAAVTKNMIGVLMAVAQLVVSVYGLTRYMEYYENNKLKELKK